MRDLYKQRLYGSGGSDDTVSTDSQSTQDSVVRAIPTTRETLQIELKIDLKDLEKRLEEGEDVPIESQLTRRKALTISNPSSAPRSSSCLLDVPAPIYE